MSFSPVREIKVGLVFNESTHAVGRLASDGHAIYFEYDSRFLQTGLEISPFHCPLQPGLQRFDAALFEGLCGVFDDSLPDGWGRLLLDRKVRQEGILPAQLTPLDRLAYVGYAGVGALVYEPDRSPEDIEAALDLDQMAGDVARVLAGESTEVLSELLRLNGSSSGARPKEMVCLSADKRQIACGAQSLQRGFAPWLVKFPNTQDGADAGAVEYVYALMAGEAGVGMAPVHLFEAKDGPGYFATRRFDRAERRRLHLHSACGLLHSDFRFPSLDYEDLIRLASRLTRDVHEVEKIFRLAVFNVLAHNRDDHSKNFSFLMQADGQWRMSPAYDLTFASGLGPGSEHSTTIMGEGRRPGTEHLTQLGLRADLPRSIIDETIERTQTALAQWPTLASQQGVFSESIELISARMAEIN